MQKVKTNWSRNRSPILAITVLLGASVGGGRMAGEPTASHRPPAKSRFERASVERAAGQLCFRLEPGMEIQKIEVSRSVVYDKYNATCVLWCACCSDGAGRDLTFRWSDGTGKLVWASSNAIGNARGSCRIDRSRAVEVGIRRLGDLGLGIDSCEWKVKGAPYYNLHSWVVELRSKRATAIVNVNSSDGSLQCAEIKF